jgi:DNA-binding MarR family transcriptional regulator
MTQQIKDRLSGSGPDNSLAGLDTKAISEYGACTCFNLRKAMRVVTRLYDERMRRAGLRATQFALLAHTYAMGPVALTKLAEAMVTDRTTMARNLEPLQKGGLIDGEDGKDRRTRIVKITKAGREKLTQAYPLWKRAQNEIRDMMVHDKWSLMMSQFSLLVNQIQEN